MFCIGDGRCPAALTLPRDLTWPARLSTINPRARPHRSTPRPAMDAPDDRDVKLQKVSGDLLTQFRQRLPELLQAADGDGSGSGSGGRKTVDNLICLVSPRPRTIWHCRATCLYNTL